MSKRCEYQRTSFKHYIFNSLSRHKNKKAKNAMPRIKKQDTSRIYALKYWIIDLKLGTVSYEHMRIFPVNINILMSYSYFGWRKVLHRSRNYSCCNYNFLILLRTTQVFNNLLKNSSILVQISVRKCLSPKEL